jgi:16S rRNA (cytosine1402-N4)-methyltransferase
MDRQPAHIPVMLEEVVRALQVQPGGRYVDCTVGAGGHAAAILKRSQPGGQLLGIDADPEAITIANARLAEFGESVVLVNDNFANLLAVCEKHDFLPVHGIVFDLGLASFQIDVAERGFSFQQEAALDMRASPAQETTAAEIVNTYDEEELARIIYEYGEEPLSRRIARAIVRARPVESTVQLANIIERALGGRRSRIHPATRTFQALRIAVNQELDNLQSALGQAVEALGFEGRLVVISYHSLEDRIVKQFLHRESVDCICPPETPECVCGHKATLKLINKRVITPSREEILGNPRSRSARLRCAERMVAEAEAEEPTGMCRSTAEVGTNGRRELALLRTLGQELQELFAA